MTGPPVQRRRFATPWRVFGLVLLSAFSAEGLIMLALPRLGLAPGSRGEGLVDAFVLSVVLAPALWFLAVRPLGMMHRERGELLGAVLDAQEHAYARIARDLHDGLGQNLTALLMGVRALEDASASDEIRARARELRRMTAAGLEEVRRLARGLAPAALEDFGLGPAVERLAEDLGAAGAPGVRVTLAIPPGRRYSHAVESAAYRMIQEALTNAARHAGARSVDLRLEERSGMLHVTVRDDGRGFDPDAPARAGANSLGLRGMRERALLLHGSFSVDSRPGAGTTVQAWLPAPARDP